MNPMEHFIRSMGMDAMRTAIANPPPVPNTPMPNGDQRDQKTPFQPPRNESFDSFNKRLAAIEAHVTNLEGRMRDASDGFLMVGQHIAELVTNITRLGVVVNHNAALLDEMDRVRAAMQKLLDENAKLKQSNSEFLDRVDKAELEVEWLKTDNAMLERYIAKVGGDLGRVRNPQPVAKKSKPKKKTPAK